jgi:asparagine synthase (glutamine-hydrolysing)
MTNHSPSSAPATTPKGLFLGCPAFLTDELARSLKETGPEEAWRLAFARYGTKAPLEAHGSFAVAFSPRPGTIFLAVDRFARSTLCYRLADGKLHYGERADQISSPDAALDVQAMLDYFHFHVIPAPRTIFTHVFRLPAGHYALFEGGKLTVAPYWIPEFKEESSPSFPALREEFLHLVKQAVNAQLQGGKVGCYLSGGTDSSTVAGMVREVTGEGASSYSIGFEAEGYDEMEYARLASRHFGTRHHEYYVTPDDLVRGIPLVAAQYDQPFGNSSALPGYYCAKFAREDGMESMLAGDGGDELFGGNSRYAKQKVFDWYQHIPAFLRRGLLEPLSPALAGLPLLSKINSYVEQAKVPMPQRLFMYGLLDRLGAENIFSPALFAHFNPQAQEKQEQDVWNMAGNSSQVNHMLAFDWRYTLADNDLPKVCGTATLAGIRVGFPLMDERIQDFSLKLPSRYKVKGMQLRWFFKEALRGFLPDAIITKKKHGFGLPFGVWATKNAGLKRLAEESVRGLADRGVVRHEFLDTLLAEHLPAHPGYYGEMVWIMMMMEQWMRQHAPQYRFPLQ